MRQSSSGVYQIRNTTTGQAYIGSAVNMGIRWSKHKYELRRNLHDNQFLQRAWRKYGEANFIFEPLEITSKNFLIEKEQYYLDKIQPFADLGAGYNICKIAASVFGRKHSEETKQKMSKMRQGKKHTIESKQKMSEVHKSRLRNLSLEVYKNMSDAQKGKVHRGETKRKMSLTHKELKRVLTPEQRRQLDFARARRTTHTQPRSSERKKQISESIKRTYAKKNLFIDQNGKLFNKVENIAKELGCSIGSIYDVLNDNILTCKGSVIVRYNKCLSYEENLFIVRNKYNENIKNSRLKYSLKVEKIITEDDLRNTNGIQQVAETPVI
jgi:group I intron endonuclease